MQIKWISANFKVMPGILQIAYFLIILNGVAGKFLHFTLAVVHLFL